MIDREKLEEEIRQVAYEIYLHSGCFPGRDLDNWLEAERIVLKKYGLLTEETESNKKETKKRACKRQTSKKSEGKTKKKSKK